MGHIYIYLQIQHWTNSTRQATLFSTYMICAGSVAELPVRVMPIVLLEHFVPGTVVFHSHFAQKQL